MILPRFLIVSFSLVHITFLLTSSILAPPVGAQAPDEKPKSAAQSTSRLTSPLRRALERGLASDGDIVKELDELYYYDITVRRDAEAVVKALASLTPQQLTTRKEENENVSPLHALTDLFDNCSDETGVAYEVFANKGLPELIRAYDEVVRLNREDDHEDLLFVLKTLANFRSQEGAVRIVEAARRPIGPGNYWWHSIFTNFTDEHPQSKFVMRSLRAPLPEPRTAAILLDCANQMMVNDQLSEHPFDTPAGHKQLEDWLLDTSAENSELANDATVALAFVASENRESLLRTALKHPDKRIQIEAAWAAGKAGYEFGVEALTNYSLDIHNSAIVRGYLEEIGKKDRIPAAALEPEFAAKAEFSQWLQHPNELGGVPDELEVVDRREVTWPSDGEKKTLWLIRYRIKDTTGLEPDNTGIGMVGNTTWCFFYYDLEQRPLEDVYAIHTYYEMENEELIQEEELGVDVATDDSTKPDYSEWLQQWKGAPLENVTMQTIIHASTELPLRNHNVAIATATLSGEEGCIVFDGPRTAWYPKSEQPLSDGELSSTPILMAHVGRQLLGFSMEADRKKYLNSNPKKLPPQQIVDAYEKLLAEIPSAKPERQTELLESGGTIPNHFEAYVDAIVELRGEDKNEVTIQLYEKLLAMADTLEGDTKVEATDSFSAIGEQFEAYCKLLIERNRQADVIALVQRFTPLWDHNLGYSILGATAFRAGNEPLAEEALTKLYQDYRELYHFTEFSMLAEIWSKKGEGEKGRQLLIYCLKSLKKDISESEYPEDRLESAKTYKTFYQDYVRIFPTHIEDLKKAGLTDDPQLKK